MVFGGLVLVKPSFSREKDGFSKSGFSKTIFFSRKRWFRTKTIFFSRKPKKPSFGGPSPIVLEKMVFLVFLVLLVFLVFWIFLVCWFLLVSCFVVFCLDLARTRLPSAVGPLGGGVSYIYIYLPTWGPKSTLKGRKEEPLYGTLGVIWGIFRGYLGS